MKTLRTFCQLGILALLAHLLLFPLSAATTVTLDAAAAGRISAPLLFQSQGDSQFVSVYNNSVGGVVDRGLIKFDLSAIPTNQYIASATLDLTRARFAQRPGQQTEVYRVTTDWGAGAQWSSFTTPGGDYVGATGLTNVSPYAINSDIGGNNLQQFKFDVTNLVSQWHTGQQPNYGMLLTGSELNAIGFHAGVYNAHEYGPKLEIKFDTSPPPSFAPAGGRLFGVTIGQADGFFVRGDLTALEIYNTLSAKPTWEGGSILVTDKDGKTASGLYLRDAVEAELKAIKALIKPGDTFVFSYDGHSLDPAGDGSEMPVTLEGQQNNGDEVLAGLLTDDDLTRFLSGEQWKDVRKFLFIDACNSGGFIGTKGDGDMGDLEELRNVAVFASAQETGKAFSADLGGMGLWSKELLLPTLKKADLTTASLVTYISSGAAENLLGYAGLELPLLDIPGSLGEFTGLTPTYYISSDFDTSAPVFATTGVPDNGATVALLAMSAAMLVGLRGRRDTKML